MTEKTKHELPGPLIQQLRGFERRLKSVESIMAVLGVIAVALLTFALSFLSDRLWDTPGWIRGLLVMTSYGLLIGAALWWLMHWLWRRRNSRSLARLIQKRHSRLGDRLLGIVELSEGSGDDKHSSPSLRRAAIEQVAREAQDFDFEEAVSTRRMRLYGKAAALFGAAVVVFFILAPAAGVNAFVRWLSPLSNVERYTFTKIDGIPDSTVTAHGEAFTMTGNIHADSRWHPESALCRIKGMPDIITDIESDTAIFDIPGLTEDSRLKLVIGDVKNSVTVTPMFRPELHSLTAEVTLPSYLQRPKERREVNSRTMRLLAGSTVTFSGLLNRQASLASLRSASNTVQLAVASKRFRSPALKPESLGDCRFHWTDIHGLDEAEPHPVKVVAVKDRVPSVDCSGIARTVAILAEEVVEMHMRAEDDYGLQDLWVDWAVDPRTSGSSEPLRGRTDLATGSPLTQQLEGKFDFSPIIFDVPEGALINIRGRSRDYCPDNGEASSVPYRVYVLSRAQHAKIIENQMQALRAKLEDIIREEEHLLQNNTGLSEKSPEDLKKSETTSKLKKNTREEQGNREKVTKLAGDCGKLMQEAMRNSDISEKVLSRWANMINTMKETADGDMQKSESALSKAATSKSNRKENVEKAAGLEKEIIKALRGSENEISASLEDMMAESFVNRLRAAAGKEGEISSTLRESLSETVGLAANEMPTKWRTEFASMASEQDGVSTAVKHIQNDLAGFYNRTRLDAYNEIRLDMEKKRAVAQIADVSKTIRRNSAGRAMGEVDGWKKQLADWADQLQGSPKSGGSGSCPPTAIDQADMELLIALIRARRKEEMLREQTRLAEDKKEMASYRKSARRLSRDQHDLANTTRPLERSARDQKLKELIQKVGGEMMNAGMLLRKPKTDAGTIAIQTEIIELLSGCISDCEGQMGGGGSAASIMMAMGLQPGMGAGAGMSGGGSTAGGSTNAENQGSSGTASSDYGERGIETTGGLDTGELPAEFRDIIQAYLNAVGDDQ